MTDDPDNHRQRSEFIRELVQRSRTEHRIDGRYLKGAPRTIVQFWHSRRDLPNDVKECIASWSHGSTVEHHLFDEIDARAFIRSSLGERYERSFLRCYHPAMQADYFRLCYIFVKGGAYIDADDVCVDTNIDWLFEDGRLKLQPLCYDVYSETMVSPSDFLCAETFKPNWIFYFNNNPLIADRYHPIVERALRQATHLIELADGEVLPEIQATTGPGNLSKSTFDLGRILEDVQCHLVVLKDWESIAISKWPLSYRDDARNWRHSNRQRFRRPGDE